MRGRHGHDCMVGGFTTTYSISAYHHWCSIRARCTTLCDKVCQWLTTGRWFSPGPPVSSTNKTDCHDITEILLKVQLNTIKPKTNYIRERIQFCAIKIVNEWATVSGHSCWSLPIFRYIFHVKPHLKKNLYRGHFLTNFADNEHLCPLTVYHGENKWHFTAMMVMSALYYTNIISYAFIMLAHWDKSPVDMNGAILEILIVQDCIASYLCQLLFWSGKFV